MDVKKAKLALFLAADCCRIPSLKDIDVGKIANRIDDLRSFSSSEMNNLSVKLSSGLSDLHIENNHVIDDLKSSMSNVTAEVIDTIKVTSTDSKSSVSSACTSAVAAISVSTNEFKLAIDKQSNDAETVSSVVDEFKAATKQAESYAERLINSSIGKLPDSSSWFTMVNGKPRIVDACSSSSTTPSAADINRRKITGCISAGTLKIKSSRGNSSTWNIFVGKLDPCTVEQDITDHLTENGISVINVTKLKAVQKWQEKSAAFKVSVAENHKCDIMKSELWPDHVEIRDWVFKPRP